MNKSNEWIDTALDLQLLIQTPLSSSQCFLVLLLVLLEELVILIVYDLLTQNQSLWVWSV